MRGKLTSAVLRFSEQDGPTIALHDAVLEKTRTHVWWGWWKKEFEPGRAAFLTRLRKLAVNGGVDVALLNRKDERYYVARLVDVAFKVAGNISAPGPECPEQYRDRPGGLPAWFKISRIDQIEKREYESRFGDIPTGEPTLYEVRRDDEGALHVYPQPSWDLTPTVAPGNIILHLSDLHFGEFHGYRVGPVVAGERPDRPTLLDRVNQIVDSLDDNIGVVVVSGDLVSKSHVPDFHEVEDFLNQLLEDLRLNRNHVVCVPGNHDFNIIKEGTLPTVDYGHERAYRDFVERFYGPTGTEIERLSRYQFPVGRDVVFALLNSARLRGHESREYGYVGRDRYEEMLDHLQEQLLVEGKGAVSKIAVLHHHVLPVKELEIPREGTPISLTVDAAELFTELQERSFDAVLHGHQHLPFFMKGQRSVFTDPPAMSEGRRQLSVVGSGAAGASLQALNPEFAFNALGTYQIAEDALEGRFWHYTDRKSPRVFATFSIPWGV